MYYLRTRKSYLVNLCRLNIANFISKREWEKKWNIFFWIRLILWNESTMQWHRLKSIQSGCIRMRYRETDKMKKNTANDLMCARKMWIIFKQIISAWTFLWSGLDILWCFYYFMIVFGFCICIMCQPLNHSGIGFHFFPFPFQKKFYR